MKLARYVRGSQINMPVRHATHERTTVQKPAARMCTGHTLRSPGSTRNYLPNRLSTRHHELRSPFHSPGIRRVGGLALRTRNEGLQLRRWVGNRGVNLRRHPPKTTEKQRPLYFGTCAWTSSTPCLSTWGSGGSIELLCQDICMPCPAPIDRSLRRASSRAGPSKPPPDTPSWRTTPS